MGFFRRRQQPPENDDAQPVPEVPADADSAQPVLSYPVLSYEPIPDSPIETTSPFAERPAPQETQAAPEASAPRRHLLPFVINWPALVLIVVLVALMVVALLLNQGTLPAEVVAWWPLVLLVPAAVWFLVAVLSHDARGLLGSAALFGVSASLLLGAQKGTLLPTVVGITFIATGAGIMLRGLLMRNQPIT